jgi:hypothetical protein
MRRAVVLLPLLALGAGATALAQESAPQTTEPDVRSRDVFRMPAACRPGDRVTIRVNPSGAVLASVRIHVAGLEVIRLTGVHGPASATVRLPRAETRVTATGDTLGGQALYRTRIYNRCPEPPRKRPPYLPVIGGGED